MHSYYDTIVFSYFFYNPNAKNKYSPIQSSDISPIISFFSIEEFLHVNLRNRDSGFGQSRKYYELWEDLELLRPFFEVFNVEMTVIDEVFKRMMSRIINYAQTSGLDYNLLYQNHNIPEMMDIVHLVTADVAGAVTFITADKKFEFFEPIQDLPLKNVTEIIILDRADFDPKKEHRVYLHHAPA